VPSSNLFLRHLPVGAADWLRPRLQRVSLKRDQLIVEQGDAVRTAILPIDCILSVITVMRDGRQVESRTIGRETGFGLLHALGSPYAMERVEVQIGGDAWILPLGALSDLAARDRQASHTMACFAQAAIVQTTVSVACNALHDVESRLCRWLLLTQDRLGSDVLPLTQEHLAIMLAVQRTTVTVAAARVEDMGLIARARGRIRILDRRGLVEASCECFEQIEAGVQRLVSDARR
jgi:CRP-like cAMP-binding protein